MQRIGYHLFHSVGSDDVFDLFYDKLEYFHKFYISNLLIYSAISIDSNLDLKESVSISDHVDYSYIEKLNKSLKDAEPIIEVEHLIAENLDCSLNLFYVQEESIEGFYVSEISTDLDDPNRTHYQLFSISSKDVNELNNHWLSIAEDD